MSANTTGLLVRNVFHLGMGQIATTALGIVSAAVVGRALEPADFGVLYVVFSIAAFVGVIADWGQGTCLVREVARGRSDEAELIGSALLIRLGSTAVATALAGAVAFGLGYDERVVMLTLMAMIVSLPTIVSVPYGLTFRAKNLMGIDAMAGVVSKAAALVATIFALRLGGGLRELVLMQGVGAIASLMLVMFFVARHELKTKYPTRETASVIVWGGIAIVAFALLIASQPFLEVLILSALTAPVVVGWYGASRTILGIIVSPALILAGASFPELSRAAHSTQGLRHLVEGTSRVMFIAAAITASFLYLFADHLVHIIYGYGRFEGAVEILRASAVVVPLLFFSYLLASTMWAVGRSRAMVVINIARVAFCAIASWFLIGVFEARLGNGAIGLVLIGGVAEVPAVIAYLVILAKDVDARALVLGLARSYVVAVLVVATCSLLVSAALWYLIPAFTLAFAVVAMALRLVRPSDLRLAIDIARRKAFLS